LGWAAIALVVGFVIWTHAAGGGGGLPDALQILGVLAVICAARLAASENHDGKSLTASAVAMVACVGSIFASLYPDVMISTSTAANNLTVANSASGSYALKVMSIAAVVFVPLVLLYQGWSFHVFRARVKTPPAPTP